MISAVGTPLKIRLRTISWTVASLDSANQTALQPQPADAWCVRTPENRNVPLAGSVISSAIPSSALVKAIRRVLLSITGLEAVVVRTSLIHADGSANCASTPSVPPVLRMRSKYAPLPASEVNSLIQIIWQRSSVLSKVRSYENSNAVSQFVRTPVFAADVQAPGAVKVRLPSVSAPVTHPSDRFHPPASI